jgi:hypothetical protein
VPQPPEAPNIGGTSVKNSFITGMTEPFGLAVNYLALNCLQRCSPK